MLIVAAIQTKRLRRGLKSSHQTTAIAGGNPADSRTFPNGKGFHKPGVVDGLMVYELQQSAVVRFVSRPTDYQGHHSLVPTSDDGGETVFDLPVLSLVTLEALEEAGEWTANGFRVRQRCYTVSVTWPWLEKTRK